MHENSIKFVVESSHAFDDHINPLGEEYLGANYQIVTFRSQKAEDYSGEGHLEHNNEERETEIYPFVRPTETFNTYMKKLKPCKDYVEYTYNYRYTNCKFEWTSGEPTGVYLRNYPVFISRFSGMWQIAGW
jgi:hypothetical protein